MSNTFSELSLQHCYVGSEFLKVLGVDWNPIGDDGILLLIEGLKDNNVLIELNVQNCSITAKGKIFAMAYTWVMVLMANRCLLYW